jgi:hypothetical protein
VTYRRSLNSGPAFPVDEGRIAAADYTVVVRFAVVVQQAVAEFTDTVVARMIPIGKMMRNSLPTRPVLS